MWMKSTRESVRSAWRYGCEVSGGEKATSGFVPYAVHGAEVSGGQGIQRHVTHP